MVIINTILLAALSIMLFDITEWILNFIYTFFS
nr:MAG TPA: hypothetical protein [Bacteriophage sp.]DAZ75731.1 MAG TPA: hypothetical protein [Caudoviricetes sp.]